MKKTICVILSLAVVAALALIGASWFLYQNLPEVKAAKAEKLLAEVKNLRNGILELKERTAFRRIEKAFACRSI